MTPPVCPTRPTVSAALGVAGAVSGLAIASEAAPAIRVSNVEPDPVQLAQITSVSDLTDVLPSDWAFQALQSLVENYGCVQGYPDRTFRGQRSMTRFEFAAGLNACLDAIAPLIAQSGIIPEDLATLRRLQAEFQAELVTLHGRVDALEAKVATLEAQQFTTTTKLRGRVDMQVIVPFDTIAGRGSDGCLRWSAAPASWLQRKSLPGEGYWGIPLNPFLTITPALVYGNANQFDVGDNTGFWGLVRTTFRF